MDGNGSAGKRQWELATRALAKWDGGKTKTQHMKGQMRGGGYERAGGNELEGKEMDEAGG
jgi:hypothetical protein